MKIIADTHIWYYLGQDSQLLNKVKGKKIAPSFVNIYELSKTENIIDKEELTRKAIQSLFYFQHNSIFEPPFIYIAQLLHHFTFNPEKEIGDFLNFTSRFAKGACIKEEDKEEFRKILKEKSKSLETAANVFNEQARKIEEKIVNRNEHKKLNTYRITAGFINFCVEASTGNKFNLEGFDFKKIELLVKVLDKYFKSVELGYRKIKPNDWFDFAILSYIQPGDKFWTTEKQWITLIKEANCGQYLFKENE